jgi:hypothetical protein
MKTIEKYENLQGIQRHFPKERKIKIKKIK